MKKEITIKKYFKRYICNFILLSHFFFIQGCGNSCTFLNRLMNDPSCHKLNLTVGKSVTHLEGTCGSVSNSKQITATCVAGSGTSNQCSATADSFPLYALFVENNSSGSYVDSTGTRYSTCRALVNAFWSGTLKSATGFYYSDNSTTADTLTCDSVTGCTLGQSTNCIAGFSNGALNGIASFTTGNSYLACTYIDTSNWPSSPVPSNIAVGTWDGPMQIISAPSANHIDFTSGWVDAY